MTKMKEPFSEKDLFPLTGAFNHFLFLLNDSEPLEENSLKQNSYSATIAIWQATCYAVTLFGAFKYFNN